MRPGTHRRRWVLVRLLLVAVVLAAAGCDRPPQPAPPADAATPTPTGPRAPADVVLLSEVDPSIVVDIRYAGPHNFVGRPIDGYDEPLCLLTRTAAEALRRVQDAARARRLSLGCTTATGRSAPPTTSSAGRRTPPRSR